MTAAMLSGVKKPRGPDLTGVTYSPLTDQWSLNRRDLDVNYMGTGTKAG